MLSSLETALENLGWKPVVDGPEYNTISFEVLATGFESDDDGRYPVYSLIIYAKYDEFVKETNEKLVAKVKEAMPLIYTAAGNYDVETEIGADKAEMTFINLRDRQ